MNAPPGTSRPRRRLLPAALAVALLVAALAQLWPTLGLAYAYDDMDCLNLAADVMVGERGFGEVLVRPHNEHVIPLMRVAYHASLAAFGMDARPFRLLIAAAHAATGWLLALLVLRCSGRPAAAWATGLVYVLATGLSSMPLWVVIASGPALGGVGFAAAMLAIASRDELGIRRAHLLAGLGIVSGLAWGAGQLLGLALAPAAFDELERRRSGDRRPIGGFALFCLAAMAATVLTTLLLYGEVYGRRPETNLFGGLPRAAFLAVLVPYRFVLPGLGLPFSGSNSANVATWLALGAACTAPFASLTVGLWRHRAPRVLAAAGSAGLAAAAAAVLVGAGRWRWSPADLFEADRYYLPFLQPLALLVGALVAATATVATSWSPSRRLTLAALAILALGAQAWLHHRAILLRVPWGVFEQHEQRFAQLGELKARLVELAETADSPLTVPAGDFLFPDVHNKRVSSQLLVVGVHPRSDRVTWTREPLAAAPASRLEPVLRDWARSLGGGATAPQLVDGRLQPPQAPGEVDFRVGAAADAVIAGFHEWEGAYRWMSGEGILRLRLAGPRLSLVLAAPVAAIGPRHGWDAIPVVVTAKPVGGGRGLRLGEVRVTRDQPAEHVIDASPALAELGRDVTLHLTTDRTWRPAEDLPPSQDPRTLSVLVVAVTSGS